MPHIGNNHPNWLIFFKGVQNTNQKVNLVMILVMSLVMILGPSNSFSWHHQHSRHSPATSCQHRRWGQGKQHLSFGFQRFSSKARAVAGAGPLKAWESYGIGFSLEEFNMSFRGLRLQCCFPTSVQLNSLGPLELTSLEVAETGRFVAVWLTSWIKPRKHCPRQVHQTKLERWYSICFGIPVAKKMHGITAMK